MLTVKNIANLGTSNRFNRAAISMVPIKTESRFSSVINLPKGNDGLEQKLREAFELGFQEFQRAAKQFMTDNLQAMIPKVTNGETPSDEKLKKLIRDVMPAMPEIKEVTGQIIVDKINALPTTPRQQIDAVHIKDLPTVNDPLRGRSKKKTGQGGHGGGATPLLFDLSAQTTGSLKIFTVPFSTTALMVIGSDFPSAMFENNGFTLNASRTQLTLTASNAPSQGSQLGYLYVV